jgi:hypothetical protein
MAKRDNHYEAAFEAWLRARCVPYVAVDESQRVALPARTLKNLDFIVSSPAVSNTTDASDNARWLIDVKGRQFPTAGKQYWRNWTTADELESLAGWEELFGPSAKALLVFAYNVVGDLAPLPADELFVYRQRLYGFVAVRLDHYASFARTLSRRWGTVSVASAQFRALARPARELLGLPLHAAAAACS